MESSHIQSVRPKFNAVCFDYRGVLLDHRTNRDILPGMKELLKALEERGMRLAIVSRFPLDALNDQVESLLPAFGGNLCSSSGRTKLDCIIELAREWRIENVEEIAFIDDKPENILSVWRHSNIRVIAFRGSGKYPHCREICLQEGISFVESVEGLELLLLGEGVSVGEP